MTLIKRFLQWGFDGRRGGFAQGPDFGPIGNALMWGLCLVLMGCVMFIIMWSTDS